MSTEMFVSKLRPFYWFYMERIQLILACNTPYCTQRKSSCCRRSVTSVGSWVVVYDVQNILFIQHIASSTASTSDCHDNACFSLVYDALFQILLTSLRSLWSRFRRWWSLRAGRKFPLQEPYVKCIYAYSESVNIDIVFPLFLLLVPLPDSDNYQLSVHHVLSLRILR